MAETSGSVDASDFKELFRWTGKNGAPYSFSIAEKHGNYYLLTEIHYMDGSPMEPMVALFPAEMKDKVIDALQGK
jgi:hypothetical protein